uniref:Uncharacterized protein n=1 Tax=Setaria italica TaxID=4555 RepID=K3ZGS3_SETIT
MTSLHFTDLATAALHPSRAPLRPRWYLVSWHLYLTKRRLLLNKSPLQGL